MKRMIRSAKDIDIKEKIKSYAYFTANDFYDVRDKLFQYYVKYGTMTYEELIDFINSEDFREILSNFTRSEDVIDDAIDTIFMQAEQNFG